MALQINITPSVGNNGSGMKTTTLEMEVNVEEYLEVLKEYDFLLKLELTVKTINIVTKEEEENIYDFAKIYKNITTKTITISTIVWGEVDNSSDINCIATGVFVKR